MSFGRINGQSVVWVGKEVAITCQLNQANYWIFVIMSYIPEQWICSIKRRLSSHGPKMSGADTLPSSSSPCSRGGLRRRLVMEDNAAILTDEDIQNIFEQLSDDDKTIINYLAMELEDNFKKRWNAGNHITGTNFGPKQSLELLCKLSIFLFKLNGPDTALWTLVKESVNIGG
jgi:hypothetical protein